MTTRIKICGITRQEDADAAVAAGADAVGLMFVRASRRWIDPARAAAIAERVRGAASTVAVFADPASEDVRRVLDVVAPDVLQFHGTERGGFCRGFGVPYLKALRVREPLPLAELEDEYRDACALLLDACVPGLGGGTGQRFEWSLWPGESRLPLVLAGGLDPDNVGDAVRRLCPWGVDVSSGVEGSRPGEKDAARIRRFVSEVQRARS